MASKKRSSLVASADIAHFGQDAQRPVYLVKLPATVAKAWSNQEHRLGTVVGGNFEDGAVIQFDSDGKQLQYDVSLRPSSGMQMRVISADQDGHGVNFEGIVTKQGHLTARSFKEDLRKRVAESEVKPHVHFVTEKEARDMQSQQGVRIIKGNRKSEEDEEECVSTKDGKGKKKESKKSKKHEVKKVRTDEGSRIRETLISCFREIDPDTKMVRSHWKQKDLRKHTKLQLHRMAPILDEICDYHKDGPYAKTYSLKPV